MRRVALAALLLAALAPASAHAAFPGANGRISFTNGATISTINADGTGQTDLTSGPVAEVDASWSPDGRQIAFARAKFGSGDHDIYVMNADGSDRRQVTTFSGDETHPNWSPDGRKLVFERVVGDYTCDGFLYCGVELFTIGVDGTGERRLTDNRTYDLYPSWSPDGTRIVFQRWVGCVQEPVFDCDWDIWTIKPDGTDEVRLLHNGEANRHPDWSPDGRQIAFASTKNACCVGEIYKMDADGTSLRQVTFYSPFRPFDLFDWATSTEPAWSPDGTKIAFAAGYLGANHGEIHVVDADGSNVKRLTDQRNVKFGPDWQPLDRPPDCSGLRASTLVLLPANRKLVTVAVTGATDPDGDAVTLSIAGVTKEEPVRANGDPTSPDAARGAPGSVALRAERNPQGDGRVYRVVLSGADGRGGTCSGTVAVGVPRHERDAPVDSAPPSYDSLNG